MSNHHCTQDGGYVASAQEHPRVQASNGGLMARHELLVSTCSLLDGLRGEIERGRRSGRPKPAAEVLDRLERKYAKMTKDSGK